ncbi:MAG: histidine--tRNA ligase [Paracoccaceae bacterium]|nr:histidine--tRNA ligase [Paracoccaceae bacterium]
MAKNSRSKTARPRARLPRGFQDHFGSAVDQRDAMLATIRSVYHLYGFEPLDTPAVETVEALGKYLPDVDRPNEGVFAWQDGHEDAEGDWVALRYDLTAPLARVYAQFRNDLPLPYRRYAAGPVWRNEKPGPGRFRQFFQCDADTVGSASPAADAEMCMMLADVLEAVGIVRGDYVIRLNSRTVLDGIMRRAGILDPSDPGSMERQRGIVLRAVDKLDRLGPGGVRALLGAGRTDESGDVTEGAGLDPEQIAAILDMIAAGAPLDPGRKSDPVATDNADAANAAALRRLEALGPDVDDLRAIERLVRARGYGPDRICVDTAVVRGLGYYTGAVYEAELTFPVTDRKGRLQRFGSVAGGGRYDGLVRRFTGQAVPAAGVSVGVDRLLAALSARRPETVSAPEGSGPVVVTVMDRDRLDDYQAMVAELRQAGIRAELYLGNPKNFGNQLRYADRRDSPLAVIQGSIEQARDVVQLKDLVVGRMLAPEIGTSDAWKQQPAQLDVPRSSLVAEVRRLVDVFRLPDSERTAELESRRARYLGRK